MQNRVQREFPVMGFIGDILVVGVIVRPSLKYPTAAL
jgi:hypothetical protein